MSCDISTLAGHFDRDCDSCSYTYIEVGAGFWYLLVSWVLINAHRLHQEWSDAVCLGWLNWWSTTTTSQIWLTTFQIWNTTSSVWNTTSSVWNTTSSVWNTAFIRSLFVLVIYATQLRLCPDCTCSIYPCLQTSKFSTQSPDSRDALTAHQLW